LVRTICPKCSGTYYPPSELLSALHYQGDKRRSFSRGEGCRDCYDTGFKGRIGIYEVLVCDQEIRDLIVDDANLELIRRAFVDRGGQTLLQCALRLAEQEITSLDEVSRVAFYD